MAVKLKDTGSFGKQINFVCVEDSFSLVYFVDLLVGGVLMAREQLWCASDLFVSKQIYY